jgi:hypothetical protein
MSAEMKLFNYKISYSVPLYTALFLDSFINTGCVLCLSALIYISGLCGL